MTVILPVFLFFGLGLAQYGNGYGSIFELSDLSFTTDSSLHLIPSTSGNVSALEPTGTSLLMSPTPESTNWNPETTQTTGQHGSNSSAAVTQVLATVEVHIGNLSGSGVIALSDLPKNKTHSSNRLTTAVSPIFTLGPTNRPCFTTDSPKIPPFPANLTSNQTGFPTASRPSTFPSPSLLSLFNISAGSSLWDRSSLVSAILAPLTVVMFL